jgi:hypothetical protein
MSWFFAVVGPAAQGLDRQRLAVVTEKPHSEISSSTFYLAAGGRGQTLHCRGGQPTGVLSGWPRSENGEWHMSPVD